MKNVLRIVELEEERELVTELYQEVTLGPKDERSEDVIL